MSLDSITWGVSQARGLVPVCCSQGRHEEAIRHYTAALSLDKWRPQIWTSRGMAYYCMGEFETAARDFTR
jgi:Flp pilus assembly protein TadD